jgi:GNAT superfamily N-acetyltransferase
VATNPALLVQAMTALSLASAPTSTIDSALASESWTPRRPTSPAAGAPVRRLCRAGCSGSPEHEPRRRGLRGCQDGCCRSVGTIGGGVKLREIERLAGERFRHVGLPEVADDEPAAIDVLTRYAQEGRSGVAADGVDVPIGHVLVDIVDGCAHIEQVSVLPDDQGAGVGRALLEGVASWAVGLGLSAITLTAFRDVPWNAALYGHLGFRAFGVDELGPQLREIRKRETVQGLDPAKRVCIRSEVPG